MPSMSFSKKQEKYLKEISELAKKEGLAIADFVIEKCLGLKMRTIKVEKSYPISIRNKIKGTRYFYTQTRIIDEKIYKKI